MEPVYIKTLSNQMETVINPHQIVKAESVGRFAYVTLVNDETIQYEFAHDSDASEFIGYIRNCIS